MNYQYAVNVYNADALLSNSFFKIKFSTVPSHVLGWAARCQDSRYFMSVMWKIYIELWKKIIRKLVSMSKVHP